MDKFYKSLLSITLLIFLIESCGSSKNICGTYISNFPVNGFFTTQIKLKEDSSLEYRYWGDLVFDTATAHYRLVNNKLILSYYPVQIDTTAKYGLSAPKSLLLKNDKLFLIDKDGNLIKSKRNNKNKNRKYFLIKH